MSSEDCRGREWVIEFWGVGVVREEMMKGGCWKRWAALFFIGFVRFGSDLIWVGVFLVSDHPTRRVMEWRKKWPRRIQLRTAHLLSLIMWPELVQVNPLFLELFFALFSFLFFMGFFFSGYSLTVLNLNFVFSKFYFQCFVVMIYCYFDLIHL